VENPAAGFLKPNVIVIDVIPVRVFLDGYTVSVIVIHAKPFMVLPL
jgi:hypothetical protein